MKQSVDASPASLDSWKDVPSFKSEVHELTFLADSSPPPSYSPPSSTFEPNEYDDTYPIYQPPNPPPIPLRDYFVCQVPRGPNALQVQLASPMLLIAHERQFATAQLWRTGTRQVDFQTHHERLLAAYVGTLVHKFESSALDAACSSPIDRPLAFIGPAGTDLHGSSIPDIFTTSPSPSPSPSPQYRRSLPRMTSSRNCAYDRSPTSSSSPSTSSKNPAPSHHSPPTSSSTPHSHYQQGFKSEHDSQHQLPLDAISVGSDRTTYSTCEAALFPNPESSTTPHPRLDRPDRPDRNPASLEYIVHPSTLLRLPRANDDPVAAVLAAIRESRSSPIPRPDATSAPEGLGLGTPQQKIRVSKQILRGARSKKGRSESAGSDEGNGRPKKKVRFDAVRRRDREQKQEQEQGTGGK